MTEFTLTLIRLAFLALLWLFVIVAVGVIRSDLFGSARAQPRAPARNRPPRQPKRKSIAVRRSASPRRVVVTDGALAGTAIDLGETPVTIGRGNDATLVLSDDYASTRHARLFPQDGQWLVEDLGSTNGTYLDRSKVTRPTPVPVGAPIRIGKTVLELRR